MFDIDPRQLIARADAVMEDVHTDEYLTHRQVRREQSDALEAYRFAAVLLGARGDLEDLTLLTRLYEEAEEWAHAAGLTEVMTQALDGLMAHATPTAEGVARMARSAQASDRLAVAEQLPIDTAEGRALVASLLTDPDEEVRAAASERLPDEAPPWWSAAFSRDPLPHIAPGDRDALEPVLRQVVESIGAAPLRPEPLCAALERLPTPLLFDVVTRIFQARPRQITWERPLLTLVVERPGGPAVLRECLGLVKRRWGLEGPAPWLLRGSPERRAELALALAELVVAHEADEDEVDRVTATLADMAGREWPPEVDPAPLIACASARPGSLYNHSLLHGLRHNVHAPSWGARVLEARLAGDPRLDEVLGAHAAVAVGAAPVSVVRPLAERGLIVPSCVGWAVAELMGRCHQPGHDPPLEALAEAWLAVPTMAEAVRKARPDLALGWLRARVSSGQPTMSEVVALVQQGGLDEPAWAAVRRARSAALAGPAPQYYQIFSTLNAEHWGPDEWATADALMEQAPDLTTLLAIELCKLTAREAVPRVERALGLSVRYTREDLLAHRTRLAQLYGLELGPPPRPAQEDHDVGE